MQGSVLWAASLYPRTISTISIIRLSYCNKLSSGDFLQVRNQTTFTVSRQSLWSLHPSQLLYKSTKVRLFESRSGAGWNKVCCWKSMCSLVLLTLISLQTQCTIIPFSSFPGSLILFSSILSLCTAWQSWEENTQGWGDCKMCDWVTVNPCRSATGSTVSLSYNSQLFTPAELEAMAWTVLEEGWGFGC